MAANFDDRVCIDHSERLRKLESRAAVTENSVERLEKLPNLISSLRDTVVELKTQTKVTWFLLVLGFGSMITAAISILVAGVP